MKKPQTFRIGKLERFIAGCEIRMNLLKELYPDDPIAIARATELEEVLGNLKDEFNLSLSDPEGSSE